MEQLQSGVILQNKMQSVQYHQNLIQESHGNVIFIYTRKDIFF